MPIGARLNFHHFLHCTRDRLLQTTCKRMASEQSITPGLLEKLRLGCPTLNSFDILQQQHLFSSYYQPIAEYILLQKRLQVQNRKPLFVGISAPQGCGKTTLTDVLCHLLQLLGTRTVSLSIDDFYLTGAEQVTLAENHKHNPLLAFRGNAGTHDLSLLKRTLEALESMDSNNSIVKIPRYIKSLREGRGDRAAEEQWLSVGPEPLDVVLFEGWMLGFAHLGDRLPTEASPAIKEIDHYLAEYSSLHRVFDSWIVLSIEDSNVVYEWRRQAEEKMRKNGLGALSDEQVRDFVSRFMPAYQLYLPDLYRSGPERRTGTTVMMVSVDENRNPVSYKYL